MRLDPPNLAITPNLDTPKATPDERGTTPDPIGYSLKASLNTTSAILLPNGKEQGESGKVHADVPSGTPKLLAQGVGKREVNLSQYPDGSIDLTLKRPPITSLVLSGGGAKGAAYPGAIKSLEAQGALDGVSSMSGSSAGAITAALLASGMDSDSFKALSDEMDLITLLDSTNKKHKLFQTISSLMGEQVGKVSNLGQLLCNVLPRMGSEALPLEKILHQESSKSVLKHLAAHPEACAHKEVQDIENKLKAGKGVTFGDLACLNKYIPQIKTLNITGTAMFDGRPQMVVFNDKLTPDMEIARAAHISGSFPFVFAQPNESHQPFQESDENTYFQDGGVMLNVPVPEMIDPSFTSSPISQSQNLILKFESGSDEMPAKGSVGSAVKDWVIGAPVTAQSALQHYGLSHYKAQTVTVPLITEKGDFSTTMGGTLNFTMSSEIKNHLQNKLADAVDTHLEKQGTLRDSYRFSSLEQALLALDDDSLNALELQQVEQIQTFKSEVKQQLDALSQTIDELNQDGDSIQESALSKVLAKLDGLADSEEKRHFIAMALNEPDNHELQQALNALSSSRVESKVLQAALTEYERRDVVTIAQRVRQDLIFPSLYKCGQPDSNQALLRSANHRLETATTKDQINQVLDDIVEHYAARNKPWAKPFSSTTIEQAKAMKLH